MHAHSMMLQGAHSSSTVHRSCLAREIACASQSAGGSQLNAGSYCSSLPANLCKHVEHRASSRDNRPFCSPRKASLKAQAQKLTTRAAAATEAGLSSTTSPPNGKWRAKARIVAVMAEGHLSNLGRDIEVTSEAVMEHMAQRLSFVDPGFEMEVYTDRQLEARGELQSFQDSCAKSNIVVVEGLHEEQAVDSVLKAVEAVPTFVVFGCASRLQNAMRLGGWSLVDDGPWQQLQAALPWTGAAQARQLHSSIQELWERHSSDDLVSLFLVLIDAYVTKVERLDSLRASGPLALARIIKNCGPQIFACVNDPECKAALDCLQACSPTDQVCSYRCIVSHESQLLEDFSLCILQKHNCLGKSAEIPALPDPPPMASFRGEDLTHELAESLFIGWLGQNAAYDHFPCQYQIFYRGKARQAMWYDPVFQVRTLDGRLVWRRRHYRVRRAKQPGTFNFSVLDNGVISKEYWRIVDVPDDLSWALFAYSGAASAAGQVYTGAVLCTPDGRWPAPAAEERITAALRLAGIELWELFRVDNSCCTGMPLGVPEKDAASNPAGQSLVVMQNA